MDNEIARIAARQQGVVAVEQLRKAGLSDRQIAYRVRGRRLFRIFQGVYSLSPVVSIKGCILAATLTVGDDAAASWYSAVYLYGVTDKHQPTIHVTTTRRIRNRPGLRIHRNPSLNANELRKPHGIPTTSPAKTIVDLAGSPLTDRSYRRLVNDFFVKQLVTEAELHEAIDNTKGRATKRLASLLTGQGFTRSTFEDDFAEFLRHHDFPHFLQNVVVHGKEVDIYFPDYDLALEIDSDRYHANPIQRRLDAQAQAHLEAHGTRVLRISEADWANQPQLLRRLLNALSISNCAAV